LIEGPSQHIEQIAEVATQAMDWASAAVLDGVVLGTDTEYVYPGQHMLSASENKHWNLVQWVLKTKEASQ
jgi:hypothetical protein